MKSLWYHISPSWDVLNVIPISGVLDISNKSTEINLSKFRKRSKKFCHLTNSILIPTRYMSILQRLSVQNISALFMILERRLQEERFLLGQWKCTSWMCFSIPRDWIMSGQIQLELLKRCGKHLSCNRMACHIDI